MDRRLESARLVSKDDDKERRRFGQWFNERYLPCLKKAALIVALPIVVATSAGCGGRTRPLDDIDAVSDAGIDSDTASDGDADQDSDLVADSDIESDGDVDIVPDGDTEQDGDSVADSDIESDGDVDIVPDGDLPDPIMESLVGDYLNRNLGDREDNISGDSDSEYPIGGSYTSENANLFTDGLGGNLGLTESFIHRIDSTNSELLLDTLLGDTETGDIYLEQQTIWVGGQTHYDEIIAEEVVADMTFISYTMRFSDGGDPLENNGIPVCTDAETMDYSACILEGSGYDPDVATATHRLMVQFLGSEWVVLRMEPPGAEARPLSSENGLVNGGRLVLGKESLGGIMEQDVPVAYTLASGDTINFILDDVEAHGGVDSAILSIVAEDGTVIHRDRISPMQTKEFMIDGEAVMFHVFAVAPSYTAGASWADFSVLSKRLELEDGHELNMDEDDNPGWDVSLGWSNRGASEADTQADDLVIVSVFSLDVEDISSNASDELLAGDYIPLVTEPEEWRFTYMGLDITSDEMHRFTIMMEDIAGFGIVESSGPVDSTGEQVGCLVYAPYIQLNVEGHGTFAIETEDGGTASDNVAFLATSGGYCDGTIGELENGALLIRRSPSDDFVLSNDSGHEVLLDISGAGASYESGGVVRIVPFDESELAALGPFESETPDFVITISEDAGPEMSGFVDRMHVGAWTSVASPSLNRDCESWEVAFGTDELIYQAAGPVDHEGSYWSVEEGFVSERGSRFSSLTDVVATFSIAERPVHTVFFLVPYER